MECKECLNNPTFHCLYENVLVCTVHIEDHMLLNHDHKKLEQYPYHSDLNEIRKKLESWVFDLRNLEIQILTQTAELIKSIEQNSWILSNSINNLINHYNTLRTLNLFTQIQLDEIESINYSDLILYEFDIKELQEDVKFKFSNEQHPIIREPDLLQRTKKRRFLEKHNGGFKCLAVTNDGLTLVSGSQDTSVRLWDINSKTQITCLIQHRADVLCLAISSNNNFVVSGSLDKTLVLWDMKTKCCLKVYHGHLEAVNVVDFTQNSKYILSGSSSNEIILWNTDSGEILNKTNAEGNVRCGLIYEDEMFLVGINNCLQIWELKSFKKISQKKVHNSVIRSITISNTQKLIITSSNDKIVKAWNIESLKLYASFTGHSKKVTSVAVHDSLIISASEDKILIIWSIDLKKEINRFSFHDDHIYAVAISRDLVFSASRDSRIGIIRISTKSFDSFLNLTPFKTQSEFFKSDFTTFGSLNNVIILNSNAKSESIVLKGHSGLVKATCISSQMNFLLSSSGGTKNNLILWKFKTGSILSVLNGHETHVFCVDMSNDERFAISGDSFGKVILWNIPEYRVEFIFEGHSGKVYSVKFSANSKFFASGGNDKKLMVWDTQKQVLIHCFDGHRQTICKVFSTDDNKYFISADKFYGIKVWNQALNNLEFAFRNMIQANNWLGKYSYMKEELSKYLF